ncbi:MAG: hypothetical protein IKQ77_04485 [Prevotella sp.]|nr:hypothetical protein [Prevotella sp.]
MSIFVEDAAATMSVFHRMHNIFMEEEERCHQIVGRHAVKPRAILLSTSKRDWHCPTHFIPRL